ncbi:MULTISPECIES: M15 family metallopeptidase [unclassified Psychrobacillus]|uniref:M15 family metallopeptidase n=1 Tax=unclassified Psychrobacillus TaxID=2636677 RepID=UPI001F0EB111|nr:MULTISPECIES: M15 family metallopeptidase [unclassified Psychrobacillus]MCM3357612.1 M15 family metallopeptidase [Psychrobacillus sp. MER TA 171]
MKNVKLVISLIGKKEEQGMQSRFSLMKAKKKRKWPKIVVSIILGLIVVSAVGWIGINDWNIDKSLKALGITVQEEKHEVELEKPTQVIEEAKDPVKEEPPIVEEPIEEVDRSGAKGYEGNETLPAEPTYVDGILIASKQYPLPATYAPGESKEARQAFEAMAAEARLSGYELVAFSTYRSFDYQQQLYNRYVSNDGVEAADRYSARPGYSEHQTGLAFDIGELHFEQHFARESFGETPAGQWLASNAHKYGFIMRFPNGKEKITGYMYEPWHFRYVGLDHAAKIYEANTTLEEYLGI